VRRYRLTARCDLHRDAQPGRDTPRDGQQHRDNGRGSLRERNLIVERVRAIRRARLEGRQIGRAPLQINRAALSRDRERGLSLKTLAKTYGISKATVCRVLKEAKQGEITVTMVPPPAASAAVSMPV
jgi:hypothetical protein